MYTTHFGLNAVPFSITPDPHYLYLSKRHREALSHLLYGVNEGPGFLLLTGEVGTGKTTLCRCLIEQLPENIDVALLLNPRLSSRELLEALFDELKIEYEPTFSSKDFIDTLYSYLLTAHSVGRRTVLILDEAQNLSPDVLEQVRLLTNLETANQKLLRIILAGQPELKKILKRNNLRQLSQRITARYHLLPLSLKDTQAYINHRLAISGARSPLFTTKATRLVYRYSNGVPRLINIISDRALLGGYVKNQLQIDGTIVRKAVQEVRGETINSRPSSFIFWMVGFLVITSLVVGSWWWWTKPIEVAFHQNSPKILVATSNHNLSSPLPPADESTAITTPITEPVEVEKRPALLHLLQTATIPNNTQAAFVTLFNYWGLDYQSLDGDKACQRALTQGLACLLRTGTWDDLRRYNRPAVIELVTDNGTQHHLIVNSLTEKVATLDFSGKKYDFTREEINEYWLGQFLLLWRPPKIPPPLLTAGMSDESVIWLRKHLDMIGGLSTEPHTLSPHFDYALKKRILAFQREYQLMPDGMVGEQTMLALQALVGKGPVLHCTQFGNKICSNDK